MIVPGSWLGRAVPINATPVARDYWGTAMSLDEIVEKHAPGSHKTHFYKIAGPASVGVRCIDCGIDEIASSRQKADELLSHDRSHRCSDCRRTHQDRMWQERWRRQKEKQERVEELRWMPYPEYLGTSEWAQRRRDVIRRAGFMCQVCASDGKLHVHHRTYARRGNERAEDMIALCADCHDLFHKHGKLAQNGRAA